MNNRVILQAEDDENDVLLLRYAFARAQVQTSLHSVADGQLAIDYLAGTGEYADRTRFPLPCLVLLDIKLPRRTGLEALQWIRAQPELRALLVIMLTASAYQAEIDQAYEFGANSFVIKPAGVDELTELVKTLHDYWFGLNRLASICHRPPRPAGR